MVVRLTGTQYLDVVVQRSLTVVLPSQAFHDAICERRVMFAIFPTVAYKTCAEADSRRGVNDTRCRHLIMISGWFPSWIVVARTWYLSIYMLMKARTNVYFDPPKLGDPPPTSELFAPLFHSLLMLQSLSLQYATVAYWSPPSSILLWKALHQKQGGDGSLQPPGLGSV